MRDYTYQDMLKMQEEAAKRVREMKKRAAIAVEDESESIPSAGSVRKNLPDEVKHISYPVELPERTQDVSRPQESKQPSGLLSFLTQDKDAMLILALLAVIGQEEKDYMTSLALMYILI